MQIQHQATPTEKDTQIQAMLEKYKDSPQIDQFVKEALNLNAQLMQQKELLCQEILQVNPYCEISDKLTANSST